MSHGTQEKRVMTNEHTTDMQQGDKSGAPEQTRPGPVYTPAADIFETENAITVLADMPGVKAQDLKIDLHDSVLSLTGRITNVEVAGEVDVAREYRPGTFYRRFTLSETIDQAKIDAKLTDGVLRLELPKVERARPRQIAVRTS
jgi:HSP20 family molecular chaperone IbpA